ncbi:MAG: response regulator transcription factor [Phycisphaerales bacterium]|nr:response regulator transcription factor [Phycisphaerales bacterium]
MILRFHHPSDDHGHGSPAEVVREPGRPRLTMLLSYGGWQDQSFAHQLPRLLGPMGIQCVWAGSADDATRVIRSMAVHIAVVDLAIPMTPMTPGSPGAARPDTDTRPAPAGPRVLQLLRRLEQPPPTVVVRPPQWSHRDSARTLADALRDGAFAVLDRPVPLEAMLEVLRRIVRRHYKDHWPAA